MSGRARCVMGTMVGEVEELGKRGSTVMITLTSHPVQDTVTKSCPVGRPNGLQVWGEDGDLSTGKDCPKDTLSLGNDCPNGALSLRNVQLNDSLSLGNDCPNGTLSQGNDCPNGALSLRIDR